MADASWEDEADSATAAATAQLAQLKPPSAAAEAASPPVPLPRSASQQGRLSLEATIAAAAGGGAAEEKLDATLRDALQGGGIERNTGAWPLAAAAAARCSPRRQTLRL